MAKAIPWDLLGLVVSGDIGDFTLYQNKNRKVVAFPRTPPQVPRTPQQQVIRDAFRQATINWKAADPALKAAYETVTKRLSMCMTGLGLWIHFSFYQNASELQTLTKQSGISLQLPPPVR